MKILVSTNETQGERKSDFCWVPEGEILRLGFVCASDKENIDGKCGCRRSFVGVQSKKSTTTFKVVNFNGSKEDWEGVIEQAYFDAGFPTPVDNAVILEIAESYPVGTILEKRDNYFNVRFMPV